MLSFTWLILCSGALCIYLALQRRRRYLNRSANLKLDAHDPREAHRIVVTLAYKEFPFLWTKAMEFALFKTYAVPSMSSLLVKTGELVENCPYRVEATDLLIRHFLERSIFDCPSARAALARMNTIHRQYTISNNDMLFTLGVLVCEPASWVDRYEWRTLTPHERTAVHTYWTAIGSEMGIVDIPPSYEEMLKFCNTYAAKHVRYSKGNALLAAKTLNLLLDTQVCPPPLSFLKPTVLSALYALIDPLYSHALGLPAAQRGMVLLVDAVLALRAWVVRHLFWPRLHQELRTAPAACPQGVLKPLFPAYANLHKNGYVIEELGIVGKAIGKAA